MKNALALALILVACGKSDKKGGGASAPAPKFDIAGVNALVPAELKEKLVFEQRDILEERGKGQATFTVAAPKGWEQSNKMFAKVKPPGNSDLGFMTSFDVGSNCDGTCEPKDWAKTSEKVNFAQFRDGGKIIKDELKKNSHLMIAEKGDSTYVTYAWWQDGGRKYFTCSASLAEGARPAFDAFAKACEAVAIKGDD